MHVSFALNTTPRSELVITTSWLPGLVATLVMVLPVGRDCARDWSHPHGGHHEGAAQGGVGHPRRLEASTASPFGPRVPKKLRNTPTLDTDQSGSKGPRWTAVPRVTAT